MATVTITITDAPGGVTTTIQAEPDILLLEDGSPDFENITAGQAFAVGVMMNIAERFDADWRVFFRG